MELIVCLCKGQMPAFDRACPNQNSLADAAFVLYLCLGASWFHNLVIHKVSYISQRLDGFYSCSQQRHLSLNRIRQAAALPSSRRIRTRASSIDMKSALANKMVPKTMWQAMRIKVKFVDESRNRCFWRDACAIHMTL